MLIPSQIEAFEGFGPSRLAAAPDPTSERIALDGDRPGRRRLVRRLPAAPGVYGMIDVEGELIYVGKSKSLRRRVLDYLAASSERTKSQRIIEQAAELVWQRTFCEFSALLRELELIRRWRPRLNVRGQPGRSRSAYLCLGRGPAGRAYLAAEPSARAGWLFGPIAAGRQSRRLVRRVNDHFRLCDGGTQDSACFADQLELFPAPARTRCLRHALGTCLGLCAAACSRGEYDAQVRAARRFLGGRDVSPLRTLRQEMLHAAAARQFERAARLRDAWDELGQLRRHLARLRRAKRRYSFVYPSPDPDGPWFLVQSGQVAAVAPPPRDPAEARRCLDLLDTIYPKSGAQRKPLPEDRDLLLLVAGWFRDHPHELLRKLSPSEAKQRCRRFLPQSPRH